MLTQDRLKELVEYDPVTGIFTAKIRRGVVRRGQQLGYLDPSNGYYRIGLDHQLHYAHRLAWLYVYGEWPQVIDHIDQYRTNNAINNLRNVTQSENIANQRPKGHRDVGVQKRGNKYRSMIMVQGKQIHLGTFTSEAEASAKRQDAYEKYFGG